MKIKATTTFSHGSTLSLKKDATADVDDALGKLLVDRGVAEKVEAEPAKADRAPKPN